MQRAIHKRARIAFIGVADDIFLLADGVVPGLPFDAGGETAAAAPAQAGAFDLVDDVFAAHLVERFRQPLVAIGGDVRLDGVIRHAAAVRGHQTQLPFEIFDIRQVAHPFELFAIEIAQVLHNAPIHQMLVDDARHIFGFQFGVKDVVRLHHQRGSEVAGADTSRLVEQHLIFQPGFAQRLQQRVADGVAAGRDTTGAGTDAVDDIWHPSPGPGSVSESAPDLRGK